MRKVIVMMLLLSLASFLTSAQAETNVEPQYVPDQAPLLGGKNVIYLSWYTGNISDSQNFEKNLLENFALHLSRLGVPKDTIPEIISNISSITPEAKLTDKNFVPDKDKFKAEISYNMLRLKELGGDVQILTPPWGDAEEINLNSPEVQSLTDECGGTTDDIKAIEFVPAEDMSNLKSVDEVSVLVTNALNNGNSLVTQDVMVNPEIRNAAVLVKKNFIANKSSGLNYMVIGNNQETVNCILWKISDAGGVRSSSTQASSPQVTSPPITSPPITSPPITSPPVLSPIPPVPELSPVILVLAGLFGILLLSRMYK